jgi:hypothetical protein
MVTAVLSPAPWWRRRLFHFPVGRSPQLQAGSKVVPATPPALALHCPASPLTATTVRRFRFSFRFHRPGKNQKEKRKCKSLSITLPT